MRCYKKAMFRIAITGTLAMGSLAMGLVTEAPAGCVSPPGLKVGAFHLWTPPFGQGKTLGSLLRVVGCCHLSGL
jgi:hypothetical protein